MPRQGSLGPQILRSITKRAGGMEITHPNTRIGTVVKVHEKGADIKVDKTEIKNAPVVSQGSKKIVLPGQNVSVGYVGRSHNNPFVLAATAGTSVITRPEDEIDGLTWHFPGSPDQTRVPYSTNTPFDHEWALDSEWKVPAASAYPYITIAYTVNGKGYILTSSGIWLRAYNAATGVLEWSTWVDYYGVPAFNTYRNEIIVGMAGLQEAIVIDAVTGEKLSENFSLGAMSFAVWDNLIIWKDRIYNFSDTTINTTISWPVYVRDENEGYRYSGQTTGGVIPGAGSKGYQGAYVRSGVTPASGPDGNVHAYVNGYNETYRFVSEISDQYTETLWSGLWYPYKVGIGPDGRRYITTMASPPENLVYDRMADVSYENEEVVVYDMYEYYKDWTWTNYYVYKTRTAEAAKIVINLDRAVAYITDSEVSPIPSYSPKGNYLYRRNQDQGPPPNWGDPTALGGNYSTLTYIWGSVGAHYMSSDGYAYGIRAQGWSVSGGVGVENRSAYSAQFCAWDETGSPKYKRAVPGTWISIGNPSTYNRFIGGYSGSTDIAVRDSSGKKIWVPESTPLTVGGEGPDGKNSWLLVPQGEGLPMRIRSVNSGQLLGEWAGGSSILMASDGIIYTTSGGYIRRWV